MDENILEWLLAEDTPEVRLRTLKEYLKLSDDDTKVIECKNKLLKLPTPHGVLNLEKSIL